MTRSYRPAAVLLSAGAIVIGAAVLVVDSGSVGGEPAMRPPPAVRSSNVPSIAVAEPELRRSSSGSTSRQTPRARAGRILTTRPARPTAREDAPPPTRVDLPRVGRLHVVTVGVTAEGQLELPVSLRRLGWYRFGSAPGQSGSVVLAGHVDSREDGIGPLAMLRTVRSGERVTVRTSAATHQYRVVTVTTVQRSRLADHDLFRRAGPEQLAIVTCGGSFDRRRGYSHNVIMIARPLRGDGR